MSTVGRSLQPKPDKKEAVGKSFISLQPLFYLPAGEGVPTATGPLINSLAAYRLISCFTASLHLTRRRRMCSISRQVMQLGWTQLPQLQ